MSSDCSVVLAQSYTVAIISDKRAISCIGTQGQTGTFSYKDR